MNIDPFNKYSEDKLWTAIEKANMKEFVMSLQNKLLFECSEGGENLR